jgi:pimeloyl-ACP methyl ester carboxylesterase
MPSSLLFDAVQFLSPQLGATWVSNHLERPPRQAPRAWEEPPLARARPIDAYDSLQGWAWGRTGRPRVLLVHGFGGRASQMGALGDHLARAGFEALAFDGPAHGRSPGRRTDPFDTSEALLRVGREWGPFAAVVGHSFGAGCLTFALARGLPARSAVLLAGPRSFERFLETARVSRPTRRVLTRRYRRRYGTAAVQPPLERIERPVLVVHDADDRFVPYQDAVELAHDLPRARLHTLHGVGHFGMLKHPEVLQVSRFFIDSTPE